MAEETWKRDKISEVVLRGEFVGVIEIPGAIKIRGLNAAKQRRRSDHSEGVLEIRGLTAGTLGLR